MQHVGADGDLLVGVPDGDVGVGANRDGSLAWKEAVNLGCRGGAQIDEALQVDAPLLHPFRKQERQADLKTRHAAGDFLERRIGSLDQLACLIVAVGRVVRREYLERAVGQPEPDRLLGGGVAGRRAAAELGPLGPRQIQVLGGEKEVLWTGFAIDLEAQVLSLADLVARLFGGNMDNQQRRVQQARQRYHPVGRFSLAKP